MSAPSRASHRLGVGDVPLRRILMLVLVTSYLSTGCTLKYQEQRLDDPWFDSRTDRGIPIEIGLMTPNIPIGFSGLALSIEYGVQAFETDAVPPLVDFGGVALEHTGVAARFYPVNRGPVLPYGGGGFGRSRLDGTWQGPNFDVQRYDCIGACTGTYTETFYTGYHPHVVAGVELRIRTPLRGSFLGEYRKDFNREDDFYKLGGDRWSFGMRWVYELPG